MAFKIVCNNIVQMKVDAIVNAANTDLLMGSGVCGAIFEAAGIKELQEACSRFAPINTGYAVITPGFSLSAKYIIHTAGPIYYNYSPAESEQLLHASYTNSLKRAIDNNCESIAFPLISSGIYGYPKEEALRVASRAIREFLEAHEIDVFLVVFDRTSLVISPKIERKVKRYIATHFQKRSPSFRRVEMNYLEESDDFSLPPMSPPISRRPAFGSPKTTYSSAMPLEDVVENLDESFTATLLRLIDKTGKSDVEIYKRANIDRRLFSKIKSNPSYAPSKSTVLAFSIALELSLKQTQDLLSRAGFALSHSRKFDVIVEYFITNKRFDIYEINEVLFTYDQTLLG